MCTRSATVWVAVVVLAAAAVAAAAEAEAAAEADAVRDAECETRDTCDRCAQGAGCVWCPYEVNDGIQCRSPTEKPWCPGDVINADQNINKIMTIDADDDFSQITDKVIQLKPQGVTITARPGQTVPFEFYYRPAKDYPLDVYYLIDYSESMKKFIKSMKEQGVNIYKALKKLTNNVNMGIGSFIEKPALPYSSIYKKTYSYKNHMKLQDVGATNVNFEQILNKTETQSNFDNPEAGLDALLQVMVCLEELQWRQQTTRLILFITDDMYHSAGNGKMAGAYRRHDGLCYLQADGNYSLAKSLELDYPSVPYLNYVAKKNDFTIIFVVAERVMPDYKALASTFTNAKAQLLLEKGDDVINLIESQYMKMQSKIKLVTTGDLNNHFNLSLEPDCRVEGAPGCGVTHNSILKISGQLKVLSCPSDDARVHNITLKPQGTSDNLQITLNFVCTCDAYRGTHPAESNSSKCNERGSYQFGSCTCNPGWSGKHCECDSTKPGGMDENSERCQKDPKSAEQCSEHGKCSCGECVCKQPYYGRFCECNEMAVECQPDERGAPVCWGHGKCGCDRKCHCHGNYRGYYCNELCEPNTDKCQHVFSDEVCSGVGNCTCGRCICPDHAAGEHCQQSADSQFVATVCRRLEPCVSCHRDGGELCAAACTVTTALQRNATRTTVLRPRSVEIKEYDTLTNYVECRTLETGASCHILFKFSDGELAVRSEADCTKQQNILYTVLGVIVGVVVVGLLTLVAWKLLTQAHDRREYARFEKEMRNADWADHSNPIYHPATTTINNPAFQE